MRVPQVSERVKELPAQALRGVFAGVGQLLLITDKLKNKTPAGQQGPPSPGQKRPEPVANGPAPGEKKPEARDLNQTGNVRPVGDARAGADGAASAAAATARAAEVPVPEAGAHPAGATAPTAGEPDLPLPNYDELSIASLRARLRNLDITQVRQLAEYERAHAARADVLGMLERRIVKLEAGANEDAPAEAGAEAQAEAQEKADTEAQAEAREEVAADVREEVEGEAEEEV